ncbi:MAG: BON domain-containing protein [Chloroflexi bacterium]|nr:BON domain-containing protein [Chloroflexota bacterium]
MTDRTDDTTDQATADAPAGSLEEDLIGMAGARPREDQAAYVDASDIDSRGELTDTEVYEGELEAGPSESGAEGSGSGNLEALTELELRSGETGDAYVAAEEGLTYVPPIDPPVVPSDDDQGIEVASGFGTSSLDEPYDGDHASSGLSAESDLAERVRDALRADASTSRYADQVVIGTRGGLVVLRGMVDDIDDGDDLAAVANYVEGVIEVRDELDVRALE